MTDDKTIRGFLFGLALFLSFPGLASAAFQYPVQVTAFGAKCDGSTDDTISISNAVAAATANGLGGTIQFPAGTCIVNSTAGDPAIVLNNVALVGAETPHNSIICVYNPMTCPQGNNINGTVLSIGKGIAQAQQTVPFILQQGVTIRGINFIYPSEFLPNTSVSPYPALFSDDGTHQVSNILFENVHVIAAYAFWYQQGASVPYGNIRFVNSDVYGIKYVFNWSNVAESVTFDNFDSNPSLCLNSCAPAAISYTEASGVWFHVTGGSHGGNPTDVAGLQASNLTVAGYSVGVLVDSNGHLDESLFGPTTVFDTVPTVLSVNSNGSITHTVFSGKAEFGGSGTQPAFELFNPQHPLPNDRNEDHNSLSLNGFTADGVAGYFLYATSATSGDIGSISMVGTVVRHYCNGSGSSALDGVYVNSPNASTTLLIAGSQITTANSNCGGLSVNVPNGQYVSAGNITGYLPNN